MSEARVATRSFSESDQLAFAQLSGDHNPMHVDFVGARRLLYGSAVVHGIHTLAWVLDALMAAAGTTAPPASVKADFLKPVRVGDTVAAEVLPTGADAFEITVRRDRTRVMSAEIRFDRALAGGSGVVASNEIAPLTEPAVLDDEALEAAAGAARLAVDASLARRLFPVLAGDAALNFLATLLGTTNIVGMRCPGLHSLYSGLELSRRDVTSSVDVLEYRVTRFDRRFGAVFMDVESAAYRGEIRAFKRPSVTHQPDMASLSDLVAPHEFSGQRAFVVGGSRGLGELSAKLLAAGGAEVLLTFHRGRDEANALVGDIRQAGGQASCMPFDVLAAGSQSVPAPLAAHRTSHLYYFATPFISGGTRGEFSASSFRTFCAYYVDGFMATLEEVRGSELSHVLCPSTVFLDEMPADMAEYVAAKAASEAMCEFVDRRWRGVSVHRPRFPRVATDQTATILPGVNADPVPVVLGVLRSMVPR